MDNNQMDNLLDVLTRLSEVPIETEEDFPVSDREEYYQEFKKIYKNGFRHWYSLISDFLEKQTPDIYSTLENALSWISEYGKKNFPACDETNSGIDKLLDHIELESRRIDRMKAVRETSVTTNELYIKTVEVATKAQDSANDATEKIAHFHEQSVEILSIFSAVVLAFMGGISFSNAILQNFQNGSMFRLIVTIVLLGFIVCNALFILLRCILYIIYKDKSGKHFLVGWMKALNIAFAAILAITILLYSLGIGNTIEEWGQTKPQNTSESAEVSE